MPILNAPMLRFLSFMMIDEALSLVIGWPWCCNQGVAKESVADIVGRLRFVSSSAPTIYLNEQLVKDMFVSQLGAIESFARTAAHKLAGEAGAGGLVRLGGSRSGTQEIHYDLSQPLTQALVLHSALKDQGSV